MDIIAEICSWAFAILFFGSICLIFGIKCGKKIGQKKIDAFLAANTGKGKKVQLIYNKYLERWIMRDQNGFFMLDYPDCLNFNLQFPLIDKEKVNWYEMPKAIKLNE